MSISADTRSTLQMNLKKYEGEINHLYLDTKGRVTAGTGHLVSNKNAVSGITLYKTQNSALTQPATLQEKMTEYETIAALPWGQNYDAESFEPHTSLVMKKSDIAFLLNQHIDSFYGELKNTYKKDNGYPENFDDFDDNAQLALFDMIFNLGLPTLTNGFPTFNSHLKSGDFEKAADECHRRDVSEKRNKYVKDLLLSVSVEAE